MSTSSRNVALFKWIGLFFTGLVLLVGFATYHQMVAWTTSSSNTVAVGAGALLLFNTPENSFPDGGYRPGLVMKQYAGAPFFTPGWQRGDVGSRVVVPLWMVAAFTFASVLYLRRLERRGISTGREKPALQPLASC